MKGKLYLIPTTLGEREPLEVMPLSVKKVIEQIDYYIVENEKSARRFIKKITPKKSQPDLQLMLLDKYADEDGHNYVFYGMSIEKGTFNDVYLKLEGKQFDASKLDIKAIEMPNGDTIVTEILYNGETLDGDFGDTNGKGYVAKVWNY